MSDYELSCAFCWMVGVAKNEYLSRAERDNAWREAARLGRIIGQRCSPATTLDVFRMLP